MRDSQPLVGVAMGDPAGIGSEVIIKAYSNLGDLADVVVIGDADVMRDAVQVCDSDLAVRVVTAFADATDVDASAIPVLDLDNVDDHSYGELREAYGRASLAYVERAIEGCVDGTLDAMVTAPSTSRRRGWPAASTRGTQGCSPTTPTRRSTR